MVDRVSILDFAQTSLLQTTQRLNETRNDSANNLATGRRVNQVNDDPVDFFRAKALSDRVADLGSVKGSIELGQSQLEATTAGLDAVEQFGRQLIGIANAAKTAETQVERLALSQQFNEIRNQIDNLVSDTTFLGSNLLEGSLASFSISVGDVSQAALDLSSRDTSVSTLGIGEAATTYNDFATLTDISNAIADVRGAISIVRQSQADFASDISLLNVRENFTDDLRATLQSGVGKLVNADLNQEAAVQLSAQVRSDLSFQGEKILAQGDSLLLGLFK
ncbi:hypothetical protein RYZ26_19725 [Terasakiella sp. A23]|uniref:flagellin n=1 Tax=Terasakiella sp. FCG-A23 TaxID=3080561 RepID=UPI002952C38E|nr:hypothetical protein [Terasakiella sp. A23]MDV7341835.1 hypothetical protein [Terasakiella sp. A23]